MSGIEKLTDSTRALLLSTELGAPVVALIDQLTAALEAAEKDRDNWKHWRATAVKACDRCEEREKALQARVAELEAEVAADVRCLVCGGSEGIINGTVIRGRLSLTTRAESELADLRGRVEALDFKREWAKKRRAGYQYGREALEQVEFGFRIALEALRGR